VTWCAVVAIVAIVAETVFLTWASAEAPCPKFTKIETSR